MSASTPLPQAFTALMESIGLPTLPAALAAGNPPVSVRLNPSKLPVELPAAAEEVPWCRGGYYLPERPPFTLDPAFHQGRYYVQESSSMFHARVVSFLTSGSPAMRVLDACAAPGGKTTAVIDVLPEGSVMVANEYVPARAAVLRENLIKWGAPSVIVTRGDTASLARLREAFDLIVADVPCSGEGMMRKDPEAVAQWSPALVEECAARQWEIVQNLWEALRPGGHLVYSTCTFNRTENEEMVSRICSELDGETVSIPVETSWGVSPGLSTTHTCYRFIPGVTRGEGLFVSVIRKDGDSPARDPGRKVKRRTKPLPLPAPVATAAGKDYSIIERDDRLTIFPTPHLPLLDAVGEVTDVIHEGVTLGTRKGRDTVPSHALAMSRLPIAEAIYPRAEVDRDTALRYLHGESPALPSSTPRGYVLLTWQGAPLGFVKNLGNRSNSLYPQAWRIRNLK